MTVKACQAIVIANPQKTTFILDDARKGVETQIAGKIIRLQNARLQNDRYQEHHYYCNSSHAAKIRNSSIQTPDCAYLCPVAIYPYDDRPAG